MKLSEFALVALKNFSTINDGIVLRPGSVIKTVNEEETIWAQAEVEDVFPVEFGIYDLNNFLGNISTLSNPELTFEDQTVRLSDGIFTLLYRGRVSKLIKAPEAGTSIKLTNPDVVFDLSKDVLNKLLKLSAMNGLSYITIIGDDTTEELRLQTHERNNPDSNLAFIPIGKHIGAAFNTTFKVDNLKILPDDYVVELKNGAFAKFSSKTRKLNYFISQEINKGKTNG